MQQFLAQATEIAAAAGPYAQTAFGGALLYVIVRWLQKIDNRIEGLEHAIRGLSKALWMDLANRSDAGSFVRAEAKRCLERAAVKEQTDADAMKRKRGFNL